MKLQNLSFHFLLVASVRLLSDSLKKYFNFETKCVHRTDLSNALCWSLEAVFLHELKNSKKVIIKLPICYNKFQINNFISNVIIIFFIINFIIIIIILNSQSEYCLITMLRTFGLW